jgi:hypothetical protein
VNRTATAFALTVVVALALVLGACGDSGNDLSQDASRKLVPLVGSVRQAAQSFDPDGAARALADLRRQVDRLRAKGEISEGRTNEILAAAARVEARLALAPTTTTTTTTTSPPVTQPTAEDRGNNRGQDNGKGGGGGKGKEKG